MKKKKDNWLDRYFETDDPAEKARIHAAYKRLQDKKLSWEEELMGEEDQVKTSLWERISQEKDRTVNRKKYRPRLIKWAAILILGLGIFSMFYLKNSKTIDIAPGTNRASLVLANGEQVALDSLPNSFRSKRNGLLIEKNVDGNLQFSVEATSVFDSDDALHTLQTPKAGQYQATLPDGTKVWLNADSELKFPAHFHPKHRTVYLKGEAYFEVAQQANQPFKVVSGKQEIQVLGTSFDLYAYPGESEIKTALLSGKIRVNALESQQSIELDPGHQAVLTEGQFAIEDIKAYQVIDWKDGDFIFEQESLGAIMKKIERWYDVETIWEDDLRQQAMSGEIARSKSLLQVLEILSLSTGKQFTLKDKKVHINHD